MREKATENTITRIMQMERYLDTIQEAMVKNPVAWKRDAEIRDMLQALTDYYENGQWLADYECDERGELPAALKRGVLSQDAIYHLFEEVAQMK